MASTKHSAPQPAPPTSSQPYYQPIPTDPQYVVVYLPPTLSSFRRRYVVWVVALLIAFAVIFLLWPSDPEVSVTRLRLEKIHFHTFPKISVDLTLDLIVKVRNRDFYSIDYRSLIVAISYRGKQLGYVVSDGGHLRARRSSYVNATLNLERVAIVADVIPLLEDLSKGSVTFDTVTEIGGRLGLFLFQIPLKGKVSCEIVVDVHNETVSHQNCYPV